MAALLTFFMYLPIMLEGYKALKKYSKAMEIGSYGDGPYCSKCLLENPKYEHKENIIKGDPADHEHKDSIYVRTDPQLL